MSDVLGEGDILEMIRSLDPRDFGQIDIRDFAAAVNFHLVDFLEF